LAIAEKIVATDEKNVAGRMRLAANHNNVATTLVHLDDLAGATQEYEKAMTLLEAVRTSGSLSEQGLYAKADSYTGLGEVESRFADQQSTTSAGLAHRKKACGYYQASLKIWSNVGEPGVLSPDGFESVPPAAVSARASQCQVAIASVQAAATK
jgi:hypothetical protein